MAGTVRFESAISNNTGHAVSLHLEPWGEEFTFPAGASWLIVASGPPTGRLEIELEPDRIFVYAWPRSVVSIRSDAREVGGRTSPREPAPELP